MWFYPDYFRKRCEPKQTWGVPFAQPSVGSLFQLILFENRNLIEVGILNFCL